MYRAVSKNIYIYYKLKGFKNEMKNNLNSKCITYKMTKEEMDKYLENRFIK